MGCGRAADGWRRAVAAGPSGRRLGSDALFAVGIVQCRHRMHGHAGAPLKSATLRFESACMPTLVGAACLRTWAASHTSPAPSPGQPTASPSSSGSSSIDQPPKVSHSSSASSTPPAAAAATDATGWPARALAAAVAHFCAASARCSRSALHMFSGMDVAAVSCAANTTHCRQSTRAGVKQAGVNRQG